MKCNEKYAKKEDMEEANEKQSKQLQDHSDQMIKLNKMIDVLNENLSKEIYAAVRKVSKQME